jgi:hypothetical protein
MKTPFSSRTSVSFQSFIDVSNLSLTAYKLLRSKNRPEEVLAARWRHRMSLTSLIGNRPSGILFVLH